MNDDLRRLRELERTFTAEELKSFVRHQLRNRLASVRNAAYYLRRRVETSANNLWSEDQRVPEFFEIIESELGAAEKVLSSNLTRSIGMGAVRELDAVQVIRRAVAAAGDHGVSIVVSNGNVVPVRADPDELTLAVLLLLEAALAACEGKNVQVVCRTEGASVFIEVIDDRPALDIQPAPPFSTAPGQLELGIVRRIAARSGGSFEHGALGARGARAAILLRRSEERT